MAFVSRLNSDLLAPKKYENLFLFYSSNIFKYQHAREKKVPNSGARLRAWFVYGKWDESNGCEWYTNSPELVSAQFFYCSVIPKWRFHSICSAWFPYIVLFPFVFISSQMNEPIEFIFPYDKSIVYTYICALKIDLFAGG